VLHAASGQIDARFLRISRGWRPADWAAAADGLRARGLLAGDEITEPGRRLRADLEETTDRLAAPAYDAIGLDGCSRLAELTRPISRTIVKAGMLDPAGASHRPSAEESR